MANLLSFIIVTATIIEITIADCNSSNQNPLNMEMATVNESSGGYKIVFGIEPLAADFHLKIAIVDRDNKKVTLEMQIDYCSSKQGEEYWKPLPLNEWAEFQLIITGMFLHLKTIQRSTDKLPLMEGTHGPYTASLTHEKSDIYAWHCKKLLSFGEKFGGIIKSTALALSAIMAFTCLVVYIIRPRKRTRLHHRQSLTETNCHCQQGPARQATLCSGQGYYRGDADCCGHIRRQEPFTNVGSSTVPKGMKLSNVASEFKARGLDLSQEQRQGPGEWKKDEFNGFMPNEYERVTWYVE